MTSQFPLTPKSLGFIHGLSRLGTQVFDLEVNGTTPPKNAITVHRVAPSSEYPPMLGNGIFIHGASAVTPFCAGNGHVGPQRRDVKTERIEASVATVKRPMPLRRSLHGTCMPAQRLKRTIQLKPGAHPTLRLLRRTP